MTLQHHATLRDVIAAFWQKVKELTLRQKIVVAVLILMLTIGNAMQLISINFWLQHFDGRNNGAFTTMAVSGVVYAIFFLIILVFWLITQKPKLGFLWSARSLHILFWIGFFDAANSFLSVYATTYTPEVLQALLGSLSSIFCFLLTKILLQDERTFLNPWAIASMVFLIGGVAISAIPGAAFGMSRNSQLWSFVFFLSVPLSSLYNVLQAKYMVDYTAPGTEATVIRKDDVDAPAGKGDDRTVKFVMLFADTFGQAVITLILLPVDAIPWFGRSPSVAVSWDNFVGGLECLTSCRLNAVFALLYCVGFLFTYLGSAYLNHYSPTLCSMISQLASPITALVLIIIPSLNVAPSGIPWYYDFFAVILLTIGAILFSIWEEISVLDSTDDAASEETPIVAAGKALV